MSRFSAKGIATRIAQMLHSMHLSNSFLGEDLSKTHFMAHLKLFLPVLMF